jgi:hypothetical protein
MSTRRDVLGALPGGTFGLRCSLPGVDVITGDSNDPNQFSFNSDWTDIAKLHQVGVAVIPAPPPFNVSVPFPDLGYRPFVEVRRVSGNIVFDDWLRNGRYGIGAQIETSQIIMPALFSPAEAYVVLYMVFAVPVPTQ